MEKRERESIIIFPILLRILGRISGGEGDGKFGEENQDLIKWGWGEYQVVGNFIHP